MSSRSIVLAGVKVGAFVAMVGCGSGALEGVNPSEIAPPAAPPVVTNPLLISSAHVTNDNVRSAMAAGVNAISVTSHATSGDVEVVLADCDDGQTVKVQARRGVTSLALGTVTCAAAKTTGILVAPTLALMGQTWKIGFYQAANKSDLVETEDILYSHDVAVTDVALEVQVTSSFSYAEADCKLFDRVLPTAEIHLNKTRLFNDAHLGAMTVTGRFNSDSTPSSFDTVSVHDDGAAGIRVDIQMVSQVHTNHTMDLGVQVGGTSVLSWAGMKVLVPSKTFTVSGVKYRRIYDSSLFSRMDAGVPFVVGSLMSGEVSPGTCGQEVGSFVISNGTNTNDYYSLLTLTDQAGFGVDYALSINFQ
ncbi:MAG: hypothetical protein KF789_08115 [Bdellovibrionaceae bacterium]|nr:hypothetical protein [Pseudobdellovibrionaceae bacterium]